MKLNLQADESLFRIALPPTTTNGRSGNTSGYGDDSIISSSVKNWVEMEEMEDIIVFNDKSNTHDDDIMIIPSSLSQYSSSSSNSSSSSTSFQKRPHPSSSSCSMSSHVALNSLVVTDRWIQINSSSTISNQSLQAMILVPQLA